ncbi:MAG: tRNA pseudouridine(55) synthase TruB [Pseudomonadota bacterium]
MKREKRSITGLLLLDKPLGLSSNAALTQVKILYGAQKAGHTGTLDPFASGLLPICLGEATKFAGFMLNADKTYEATIRLGRVTTTGDREGAVLVEQSVNVTESMVSEVLASFMGQIRQIPPMYSAIKVQGRPLYQLARQGVEIPREPRDIIIHRLDLTAFESPFLKVVVTCSKGTYIRVLAEDIGQSLGCGGTLAELRRTGTGDFLLDDALTLEQLALMSPVDRDGWLTRPDGLVCHLPKINLDEPAGQALLEGRTLPAIYGLEPGTYRAYSNAEEFLGLIDAAEGIIKARRMMSMPFVSAADLS